MAFDNLIKEGESLQEELKTDIDRKPFFESTGLPFYRHIQLKSQQERKKRFEDMQLWAFKRLVKKYELPVDCNEEFPNYCIMFYKGEVNSIMDYLKKQGLVPKGVKFNNGVEYVQRETI